MAMSLETTMAGEADALTKLQALQGYAIERCAEIGESYDRQLHVFVATRHSSLWTGSMTLSRTVAAR